MQETFNPLFTLDPSRSYPTLVRGSGAYLYDDQGQQYLDAIAGIAAVSLGYGRREIVAAIAAQAEQLPFAASNIFGNIPAARLARRLVDQSPHVFGSVHFTSGGSEAVETAFKICRQYFYDQGLSDKHLVISRWTSYHGATLGALSATGHKGRRKKFIPLLKDWPHIPPAYCYRCPYDMAYPACDMACARALEKQILDIGAEKVMAFIAEPVVGAAGGAMVPPAEYWPMVRDICTRHQVLLIADEVLTGFGRTGEMFALDHWQTSADLVIMAKGISSGYAPLGAIGVSRRIRSFFESRQTPLDHIFTFAANPVSTAAALCVMDILENESLVSHARTVGKYMHQQFKALNRFPIVGDIRGLGMMAGIELVKDKQTKQPFDPAAGMAARLGKAALKKGLVVYPGAGVVNGTAGDVISLFPPLIFTQEHVDEMIGKLVSAIQETIDTL
ncbi:MAG TPA: aspartate aminotransferase family protein [Desulfotignum sp.]|nr:aspartate aminotransferase family protein [Desulfotignum sp.]